MVASSQYERLTKPPKGSFFLFGVRGVGKSTWAQAQFPEAYLVDLLDESRYQTLLANPGLLALELRDLPPTRPVVLDEVQRVPSLLDEILISNVCCASAAFPWSGRRMIPAQPWMLTCSSMCERKLRGRRSFATSLASCGFFRWRHSFTAT